MNLDTLAIILLSIYAAIAFVDGVLIHLVLLRLHAHEETRGEHLLHSLRAALYALGLPVLFVFETGGVLLWAGAAVATIDFAIGFWDAWIERDARAKMGGLSRFEYVVHVAASVVHGGMIALALASRPVAAWSLDAESGWGVYLTHGAFVVEWILPGAVFLAVAHFALLHPKARALGAGRSASTS